MPYSMSLETLRAALRVSVEALQRRRANEIPEALIDRLVDLDWLEWHGGSLRLTTTGDNIYRREMAAWRESAERAASADRKADKAAEKKARKTTDKKSGADKTLATDPTHPKLGGHDG